METCGRYTIRWGNYSSVLQNILQELLRSEKFVDVTLACEGKSVKCHRVVLAVCSSQFAQVLTENLASSLVIYLTGVTEWELDALMDFMYSGEVTIDQANLSRFFQVGRMLKIRGLSDEDPLTASLDDNPKMKTTTKQQDQSHTRSGTPLNTSATPSPSSVKSGNGIHNTPSPPPIRKQTQSRKRKCVTSPSPSPTTSSFSPSPTVVKVNLFKKGPRRPSLRTLICPKLPRGIVRPIIAVRKKTPGTWPCVSHDPPPGSSESEEVVQLFPKLSPNSRCRVVLRNLLHYKAVSKQAKELASLGVPPSIPILKSHATYNDNDPRVVSDDQAQPNDQVKIRHKLAFGKETRESTLAGLRSGMSIQQCVNAFGVSRKTVYKWQKQHLISEQGSQPTNHTRVNTSRDLVANVIPPSSPDESSKGQLDSNASGKTNFPMSPAMIERRERLEQAAEMALSGEGVSITRAALFFSVPRAALVAFMKHHGLEIPKPVQPTHQETAGSPIMVELPDEEEEDDDLEAEGLQKDGSSPARSQQGYSGSLIAGVVEEMLDASSKEYSNFEDKDQDQPPEAVHFLELGWHGPK